MFGDGLTTEQLYQQQLENWLLQNGVGNDQAPHNATQQDDPQPAQWDGWPEPPMAQMPAALVNFLSWLATQGLRVQDDILPEDNVTDSLNYAWNDSSSAASMHGSTHVHDLHVSTLFVEPPVRQNTINMDVAISAVNLQVSISVQDNELINVLVNDLVPQNTFIAYLSRSIMSVVAAYGPCSSGYGLSPLDMQVEAPNTSFQVANDETMVVVCFSPHILNKAPTPPSVQITEILNEEYVPGTLHDGSPETNDTIAMIQTSAPLGDEGSSVLNEEVSILQPTASSNIGPQLALMEPMEDSSDLGLAQVLFAPPTPSPTRPRRSKYQVPLVTTEVRRSTRSTRYDGFRVPQITEVRAPASKVKPRVISSVVPSSSAPVVDPPPPPIPLCLMQDIGINRCAVPPQELTEAALLASEASEDNRTSMEEGSSSSA